MVFEVVYEDNYWWIAHNGVIMRELGSFIEPVSPEIIVKEIENEI